MCGGCGWRKGEYSCTTWVMDALTTIRTPPATAQAASQAGEAGKETKRVVEVMAAAALGAAIEQSGLVSLELSMGGVDGSACERLAAALRGNGTVHTLNLGWNALSDGGARTLAAVLPSMPRLAHLDLRGCGLSDIGGTALAGALEESQGGVGDGVGPLITLQLGGNPGLSEALLERLSALVAQNRAAAVCLRCGDLGHLATDDAECALATRGGGGGGRGSKVASAASVARTLPGAGWTNTF